MNVDWMALQDRLTAAEAALKTAESDRDGLLTFVVGYKAAISSFCVDMNKGAPIGLEKLDAALAVLVSPETMTRFKELEAAV